jgi:aldose 1-epimerase
MKAYSRKLDLDGTEVHEITLENRAGMKVTALDFGCIITGIHVPDRHGNFKNVVLSYENPDDYLSNPAYFGALIGRTSGRIKDGTFTLSGETFNLALNYGTNSGQGGREGFDKKQYSFSVNTSESMAAVVFRRTSPHLEEGYPGNLQIAVSYSLSEENVFKISYKAVSDSDTLVNLTNHSYFNLSGDFSRSIESHLLMIASDLYAELDDTSAPTGKLIETKGTPFDFNSMKEIGRDIADEDSQLSIGKGYDHPFVLKEGTGVKARLWDRETGRFMEISTDNKALVLYSQNYAQGQVIAGGFTLSERVSAALEVQRLPIGKDGIFLEDSILKQGETFRSNTEYRFGIL